MTTLTNLLGKILFPRQQPWQRERDARTLLAATVVALAFASLVGLMIYWRNHLIKF
jgi:polyferredoxin